MTPIINDSFCDVSEPHDLSSPVPQGRDTRFAHLGLDRRLTAVLKKQVLSSRRDLPALGAVYLGLKCDSLSVGEFGLRIQHGLSHFGFTSDTPPPRIVEGVLESRRDFFKGRHGHKGVFDRRTIRVQWSDGRRQETGACGSRGSPRGLGSKAPCGPSDEEG